MEQNERRYRADRDDLMRTVMGLDSGLVDIDINGAEGVFGVDKVGSQNMFITVTDKIGTEQKAKASRRG